MYGQRMPHPINSWPLLIAVIVVVSFERRKLIPKSSLIPSAYLATSSAYLYRNFISPDPVIFAVRLHPGNAKQMKETASTVRKASVSNDEIIP